MSLINDALQRAKHVQGASAATTSGNLQLRPANPPPARARSAALLWCWILGLILSAAVPFAILQIRNARPARDDSKAAPLTVPSAAPISVSVDPAPVPPVEQASMETVTNVPAAEVPEPAPVTRLQAIVYETSRPSAIVNGETVFIGSKIGDFQVAVITRESVTLVSPTQTNIFRLGQ